jgi:hypothetical protein
VNLFQTPTGCATVADGQLVVFQPERALRPLLEEILRRPADHVMLDCSDDCVPIDSRRHNSESAQKPVRERVGCLPPGQ